MNDSDLDKINPVEIICPECGCLAIKEYYPYCSLQCKHSAEGD